MEIKLLSPIATARAVFHENPDLFCLPVDVEALCKRIGIKIQYVDFCEIERKVKLEISGAIQRQGNACRILINEDYSEERARFVIAHELGHYYLHNKDETRRIVASFPKDKSPKENAANKFAAELLMPEKLVRQEYEKTVIPVSNSLAKKIRGIKTGDADTLGQSATYLYLII